MAEEPGPDDAQAAADRPGPADLTAAAGEAARVAREARERASRGHAEAEALVATVEADAERLVSEAKRKALSITTDAAGAEREAAPGLSGTPNALARPPAFGPGPWKQKRWRHLPSPGLCLAEASADL